MIASPIEEIIDEVEQAVIGPLKILEDEHDRMRRCHALEEEAPRREEILLVRRAPLRKAEQMRQARLEEGAFVRVADDPGKRLAQLRERRLRPLVLGDAHAHTHHLRKRPVRDAFAIGEAAAAVPAHLVDEPVDALLELPAEA